MPDKLLVRLPEEGLRDSWPEGVAGGLISLRQEKGSPCIDLKANSRAKLGKRYFAGDCSATSAKDRSRYE